MPLPTPTPPLPHLYLRQIQHSLARLHERLGAVRAALDRSIDLGLSLPELQRTEQAAAIMDEVERFALLLDALLARVSGNAPTPQHRPAGPRNARFAR